jgi:hypothetical protein
MLENWAFNQELITLNRKTKNVGEPPTIEQDVRVLLAIIKTLTTELQQTRDAVFTLTKNRRLRRHESWKSDSFLESWRKIH